MTARIASERRWPRHRVVVVVIMVIGLACLSMSSAATRAASRPSITLRDVGSPPASISRGSTFTLAVEVRNRTRVSRGGRLSIRLRNAVGNGRARVVGRKSLQPLRSGRNVRIRVVVRVARTLPVGRYRLSACVRDTSYRVSCKQTRRLVKVVARTVGVRPPADGAADGTAPAGTAGGSLPPDSPVGGPLPPGSTAGEPLPGGSPKGAVFQTIGGFGVSSRAFGDPHVFDVQGAAPVMSAAQQDAVLDALYVELGLTRIRPVQPDTAPGPPPVGIEIVNDNADPTVTDESRFDFGGRRLDDHAPVVARAKERGAGVAWISPLNREPWMGVSPGTGDVAEYAEWLLAQVRRFDQRGARLDYISVANEPSYSRNTMSGAFIRDVIKNLAPRLKAEGLLVPFVVADDVRASASAAKADVVLADPAARQYVGALATHLYDEPLDRVADMRSLAQRYGLPLWMTESALGAMGSIRPQGSPAATPLDWSVLMHDLLATYNVSAIDYFWGYIGATDADQSSLTQLDHDGTTYRGFTRTKVFYHFGQYSRFIRPGAVRVEMTSSNDAIKASAYYRATTRTIVAINPGAAEATTTFSAPDLAGVTRLTQTRTSPTENWATPPAVSVNGTSVTITLPPQSITTLNGTTG